MPRLTTPSIPLLQYQALADKYCAPDASVKETIANLQIPPTPTSTSFVPLPSRHQSDSSQAQLALFIREGKKVAQKLQIMTKATAPNGGIATPSHETTVSTRMTSNLSTVLEKDFTVEGKKGQLQCPFSAMQHANPHTDGAAGDGDVEAPTPHPPGDPICAAMLEDSASATGTTTAPKCPIRFLDKHSPEEIARYVETHKHELPRSHEVCLRRNQKNEEQIRKLDAKYGNLVSMIEDLSHLHAPMLPSAADAEVSEHHTPSDQRVSDWAKNVTCSATEGLTGETQDGGILSADDLVDPERVGHFDRPLKEVRVGESPSRPWGISVPIPPPDEPMAAPFSPPAPVHAKAPAAAARTGKCPFDHTKMMRLDGPGLSEFPKMEEELRSSPQPIGEKQTPDQPVSAATAPLKQPLPVPPDSPPPSNQPVFINVADAATASKAAAAGGGSAATANVVPQMVFNGPVFIGYPMEQAIQFMQQFQGQPQQQPSQPR